MVTAPTSYARTRPPDGVRLCARVIICLALLISFATAALADPKFPPLTGRIIDEAKILSAQDIRDLNETLRQLEGKSSDQLVVYTTPSLQGYEIEDFGYRLGRFWKIGQGSINNGIVLIVAPNERKVRIEVGRGLEGQMTDLMSGTIIRNAMLPAFRRGDFPAGIKAGARDIKDVLLGDAEEVRKRAQSIKPRQSSPNWLPLIVMALFIGIWFYTSIQEQRQAQSMASNMNRRRHGTSQSTSTRRGNDSGGIIVVPGGWGGSGGWSGGSSSSGDSGGGFSGGGGDFGGGGASDSW